MLAHPHTNLPYYLTPLTGGGVDNPEFARRIETVPTYRKKAANRRVRKNKSPNAGLLSTYSKYLSNNRNVHAFSMRPPTMSAETVLTATAIVEVATAGSGAAGISIPEHPGRSITQFNSGPVIQNTEFSSYAALYDEYKVHALILEYLPYSTNPAGVNEIVVLADYDNELSAGVLTTTQSAARYSTAKMVSPCFETQFIMRPPPGRSFPVWATTANTGSTSARGSLYIYAKSTANAAYLGNIVVKWIVSFRNSYG